MQTHRSLTVSGVFLPISLSLGPLLPSPSQFPAPRRQLVKSSFLDWHRTCALETTKHARSRSVRYHYGCYLLGPLHVY